MGIDGNHARSILGHATAIVTQLEDDTNPISRYRDYKRDQEAAGTWTPADDTVDVAPPNGGDR